jgi:Carboxypeptidase regulatory-like domain
MTMSRFKLVAVAALIAGFIVSCGHESPTRPTPTPTPTTTTAATIQSVRIEGPTQLSPDTSAQYTATAQMSDGTTRDVTATVTWRTSDANVLSIASGGVASARKAGQTFIFADTANRRASLEVLVLAPGTFRVTGVVREAGLPIADASVELLNGSRGVQLAKTDFNGNYRLFGIAGDVEIRASKEGYAEQVNRLVVSGNATSDFVLTQTTRKDLFGSYQLTVTARSGCNSLPQEARVRTYAATITQDGPQLTVALSGAGLIAGNFTGRVDPSGVTFNIHGIDSYYYYYLIGPFDVLEQLTPTSLLTFGGRATAPLSSGDISGSLLGLIGTMQSPLGSFPRVIASCSGGHTFALTRR